MTDQAPSERELEILKVLWELGSGSVRDVHRRMCPNNELAFNTVQTVLRIMTEKSLVTQRAEGRTFIYAPAYSREQVTQRFLRKVYDGALSELVLTLLQSEDTSPGELKDLEQLIAKARKEKQQKPGKEGA